MRRKAQTAVEYLFIIVAALIIVAITLKFLKRGGSGAGEAVESGVSAISSELSEQLSKSSP